MSNARMGLHTRIDVLRLTLSLSLASSIWDHLVEITKNGHTTVIITTHYIDECAQAHMVSLAYPIRGMCARWAGLGRVCLPACLVSMAFWRPRIVCPLDL